MRRPLDAQDIAGTRGGHRTALKSVRHYGSAHSGTEEFIRQRITAVSNIVLVIFLAVVAVMLSGRSYADAVALVGSPWVAVPLGLAIVSFCVHFKLGLQVIVEDYVHDDLPRVGLLILITFFALGVGAAALFAIVRIMLAAMTAGQVDTGA